MMVPQSGVVKHFTILSESCNEELLLATCIPGRSLGRGIPDSLSLIEIRRSEIADEEEERLGSESN